MAGFLDSLDGSSLRALHAYWSAKAKDDIQNRKLDVQRAKDLANKYKKIALLYIKNPFLWRLEQMYRQNPHEFVKKYPEYKHIAEHTPNLNPDIWNYYMSDNPIPAAQWEERYLKPMAKRHASLEKYKQTIPNKELSKVAPELMDDSHEAVMNYGLNQETIDASIEKRASIVKGLSWMHHIRDSGPDATNQLQPYIDKLEKTVADSQTNPEVLHDEENINTMREGMNTVKNMDNIIAKQMDGWFKPLDPYRDYDQQTGAPRRPDLLKDATVASIQKYYPNVNAEKFWAAHENAIRNSAFQKRAAVPRTLRMLGSQFKESDDPAMQEKIKEERAKGWEMFSMELLKEKQLLPDSEQKVPYTPQKIAEPGTFDEEFTRNPMEEGVRTQVPGIIPYEQTPTALVPYEKNPFENIFQQAHHEAQQRSAVQPQQVIPLGPGTSAPETLQPTQEQVTAQAQKEPIQPDPYLDTMAQDDIMISPHGKLFIDGREIPAPEARMMLKQYCAEQGWPPGTDRYIRGKLEDWGNRGATLSDEEKREYFSMIPTAYKRAVNTVAKNMDNPEEISKFSAVYGNQFINDISEAVQQKQDPVQAVAKKANISAPAVLKAPALPAPPAQAPSPAMQQIEQEKVKQEELKTKREQMETESKQQVLAAKAQTTQKKMEFDGIKMEKQLEDFEAKKQMQKQQEMQKAQMQQAQQAQQMQQPGQVTPQEAGQQSDEPTPEELMAMNEKISTMNPNEQVEIDPETKQLRLVSKSQVDLPAEEFAKRYGGSQFDPKHLQEIAALKARGVPPEHIMEYLGMAKAQQQGAPAGSVITAPDKDTDMRIRKEDVNLPEEQPERLPQQTRSALDYAKQMGLEYDPQKGNIKHTAKFYTPGTPETLKTYGIERPQRAAAVQAQQPAAQPQAPAAEPKPAEKKSEG